MGVAIRTSRRTSVYVPFWVAIPAYLVWGCISAVVWIVIGMARLTRAVIKFIQQRMKNID